MSAAEKLGGGNPLLDKRLVNAFVEGMVEVVKSTGTDVTEKKPFVEPQFEPKGQIAGMIGMVAGDMRGTITISFDDSAVFHILENWLMEQHDQITDEVADDVGELTNQIYGKAKTTLNELGYGFEMAIPTVILGSVKIKSYHDGATLVLPFESKGGNFYIEITVER